MGPAFGLLADGENTSTVFVNPPSRAAERIVQALVDAVPSGSYVALSHITLDTRPEHAAVALADGR